MTDPVRAKLSERMEAQHRNLLALAECWVSNPTLYDICNEFAAAFAKDLAEVSALEQRLAAAEAERDKALADLRDVQGAK